ncbi:MAG: hypothetical protein K2Q03_06360 [Sphingobacteriaceae bacterium]|nr:hypothetical protein [Sphingobacteriaceae bacterium]
MIILNKKTLTFFLKESTFAINEVIIETFEVIKKHYISIALLCFLMFITSSASGFMAFYLNEVSLGLRTLMAFIFLLSFFVLNLTLFKYIFHLLDDEEGKVIIIETLPTKNQIIRFLKASVYFMIWVIVVGLVFVPVMFVIDPILRFMVHLQWVSSFNEAAAMLMKLALFLTIILIFLTFLRVSFFPFFIIDKNAKPFESLKFSLAITKGNTIKIFMLLLLLGTTNFLYLFFNYLNWPTFAFFVNFISSFIVEPFSIVAITIAYRKMMREYKGTNNPDILHNLV